MMPLRDEFLGEEDLDLRELSDAELFAWWDLWLMQAQATNDVDEHVYSHGVFTTASASGFRRGGNQGKETNSPPGGSTYLSTGGSIQLSAIATRPPWTRMTWTRLLSSSARRSTPWR